jgi:exosortase/archaeosortase family protein
MILPFVTTFNEFLTTLIMKIEVYKKFQELIVPHLARMVGVVLGFLKISVETSPDSLFLTQGARKLAVYISWNCIGWQSLVLFFLTLFTGLQGSYKWGGRVQTITLGILGTFILNIFRITLVALIAFYLGRLPAVIFHDYFSTMMIILWLFAFWYFAFNFVLEEKRT